MFLNWPKLGVIFHTIILEGYIILNNAQLKNPYSQLLDPLFRFSSTKLH